MGDYEAVNREIQDFLMKKRGTGQEVLAMPTETPAHLPDITALLESLNRTYSQINSHLRSGDSEALKDVVLKSDIKMSLVCETLLQTLKTTTEEKNRLQMENRTLSSTNQRLEEELAQSKTRIGRLERDLSFKESNLGELHRIIKDQKDRMHEYRDEAQRARSECQQQRAKVQELEGLRARAAERFAVHETEVAAIKDVLRERDGQLAALANEKKAEEGKNSGIKQRLAEMEQIVETLNKKLQSRDVNLSLCNDELSKVLNENKMMKGDFDQYKEKSAYYEGLYNNLNKQNAYLNNQLNRMLRNGEHAGVTTIYEKKYKRKNAKKKRIIAALKAENSKLKSKVKDAESVQAISDTVCTEGTEPLIKRIDELTTANKDFRKRIAEIEMEKKEIEKKIHKLEKETASRPKESCSRVDAGPREQLGASRRFNPSSRVSQLERHTWQRPTRPSEPFSLKTKYENPSCYTSRPMLADHRTVHIPSRPDSIKDKIDTRPFNDIFSSPNFISPIMPELKGKPIYPKPNLDNNYDVNTRDDLLGAFPDLGPGNSTLLSATPIAIPAPQAGPSNVQSNLPHQADKHDPSPSIYASLDIDALKGDYEERLNKEFSKLQAPIRAARKEGPAQPKASSSNKGMLPSNRKPTRSLDEPSDDSLKTYHTTSSLKDMIARTDKLQRRFESLEEQLANIKEGNTEDKLIDKMKTYNTQYSELNIDSNDSDFI